MLSFNSFKLYKEPTKFLFFLGSNIVSVKAKKFEFVKYVDQDNDIQAC